jgi:ribosomal protein S18 acetylase RimI-like enzyme
LQPDSLIRASSLSDAEAIASLYRAAGESGSGLARTPDEVTLDYVTQFLEASLDGGLALVVVEADAVIAEIHAELLHPRTFNHILGDLTIAVHPSRQGQGIGRGLFCEFLRRVTDDMPHILRVELKAREGNTHAIGMYESIGFQKEGRMVKRVRLPDGTLDNDIPMAWLRDRRKS